MLNVLCYTCILYVLCYTCIWYVICYMLYAICYMLYIICYMIYVICYMRAPITGTNILYYIKCAWPKTKSKIKRHTKGGLYIGNAIQGDHCVWIPWSKNNIILQIGFANDKIKNITPYRKATVCDNSIQGDQRMASRWFFKYMINIRAPLWFRATDLESG